MFKGKKAMYLSGREWALLIGGIGLGLVVACFGFNPICRFIPF